MINRAKSFIAQKIGAEHGAYAMAGANYVMFMYLMAEVSLIGASICLGFTAVFIGLGNSIKINKHIKRCKE